MINIAVVEDDNTYLKQIESYLKKYELENDLNFKISFFTDGFQITENYKATFDLILMDIKMKHMNGITTAEKIRSRDQEVIIIFITNTSQYAIKGYKVNALDYILKPISYFSFTQCLKKAIKKINNKNSKYITIINKNGAKKINIEAIYYIEIRNHTLTYHTSNGDYSTSGTMKKIASKLKKHGFFRCHRCYLVNLKYVDGIKGKYTFVKDKKLLISRNRKADFLDSLTDYMREVIR
ncbi:LytR/AlgR family response regulator transcription factor [Halanaerobium praevalens]|uniref:Stage 0 sporulation protein A homolog n=1 Tax=Halanaerobium praevalens (strain ATCC 33744 / DSM 2228 / GSL) TaxID=572479 RepID=E3DM01_HALPG|nr:LytTR family DNA-binding domain-containing protein [Halanaerobium praevalens]ADO76260.1 two component transcriptional regulator, LytTR family [Halanaerobium praevalens DSM 2228]